MEHLEDVFGPRHPMRSCHHTGRTVNDGLAVIGPSKSTIYANGLPNVNTKALTTANGDQLVIRSNDVAAPTGPHTVHVHGVAPASRRALGVPSPAVTHG